MIRSCCIAAILACAATANAQPKPAPTPTPAPAPEAPPKDITDSDLATAQQEDDRPWAKGVAADEQKAALELFNEGNTLLRDALFPKAVEKYREALTHWDHPAIHYNLALALVNLDQPVEMWDALDKAMAFGAAPLDADKYDRAKGYKILVEKQLALVELSISVPDSVVVFDGKEVLKGPGTWQERVRSGEHSIVARASGYSPTQLNQRIEGGETSRLDLKLFTDAELTRYKRRYPQWLPWAITGTGVAILGVGALLHVSARNGFSDFDDAIRDCAATSDNDGCMPGSAVFDKKSSAETKQTAAFAMYAAGGLALAGGIVLVVLNQPSSYRIDPFSEDPAAREAAEPAVSFTPVFGPDLAGVAASGRF
jgi:hypothetical protein